MRVLVAGTFDLIHPGHIHLLRAASRLGEVVVVVARDENVRRFKGRPPVVGEKQRLEVVSAIKYVSKAVLGYEGGDILKIVMDVKPDIILLGPDQPFDEKSIERRLREGGLNVRVIRLKEKFECPLCSSSSIVRRIISMYRDGLLKL